MVIDGGQWQGQLGNCPCLELLRKGASGERYVSNLPCIPSNFFLPFVCEQHPILGMEIGIASVSGAEAGYAFAMKIAVDLIENKWATRVLRLTDCFCRGRYRNCGTGAAGAFRPYIRML